MNKKYKITPKNILYLLLIFAIPIICVSGVTSYPSNLRMPLMIVVAVTTAAFIFFMQKKVTITYPLALFLLTLVYLFLSVGYSYDKDTTWDFAIIYLCATVLLFIDLPESIFSKIIFVMQIICIVIALSIILSFFVEDCMLKYFSFIVNPRNNPEISEAIYRELHWSHSYSGFAREKGEAAFIMNVGIAIYFAKYFSGKKFKAMDFILLFILFCALILTSKRMLFICPIIVLAVFLLLSNKKGRFTTVIPIIIIIASFIFMISSFIPQFGNIFDRFANEESMSSLSGRSDLWSYSLAMFAKNPLFGTGIGSFNDYAYDHGLLENGERWNYYGHNVYYEFLGELGIVGCALLFGALLMILVITIKLLRSKDSTTLQRYLLAFSFSVQLTCFVYCASGNVLLYKQQIFIWYFCAAITLCISRTHKKKAKLLKEAKIYG